MKAEDSERLARIETILEEVIAPQLASYGPRIRMLENFRTGAMVVWGGVGVFGYLLKDLAIGWWKHKILGPQ